MAKHEPVIFVKISENGIEDTRIGGALPGDQEAGTLLLSKIMYELFLLNTAAKNAWSLIVAENSKS